MKTGLKFFDRKVTRNKENGMTIVLQSAALRLDDVQGLINAFNMIPSVNNLITSSRYYFEDPDGNAYLVFDGKGISKCSPEDEYDDVTGFRTAETRAQKDIFKKVTDFYSGLTTFIEKAFYNDLTDKMTNTTDAVYSCEDHEIRLTGKLDELLNEATSSIRY